MKLKRDKELLEICRRFFDVYENCIVRTEEDRRAAFKSSNFSISQTHMVHITRELSRAVSELAEQIAKRLGAVLGSEKRVRDLAFKHASRRASAEVAIPTDTAVKHFLDDVERDVQNLYEYILPNYVVRFGEGVTDLKFGPVAAKLATSIVEEHNKSDLRDRLEFVAGDHFIHALEVDNQVLSRVQLHRVCWSVQISAAPENVNEEAGWLIDVALSLLRLSYTEIPPFFPGLGDVEDHPWRRQYVGRVGIRRKEGEISVGGWDAPRVYVINKDVYEKVSSKTFQEVTEKVFFPSRKSLAERVAQGLGWLTRGRQAADRSERLLYFFTAIEALLSSDDKSAPLVQNISRHAAVMLSNNNEQRANWASAIKRLYTFRSALVHNGRREVSLWTANKVEHIAEALYIVALRNVDLAIPHAKFSEDLATASYGLPWLKQGAEVAAIRHDRTVPRLAPISDAAPQEARRAAMARIRARAAARQAGPFDWSEWKALRDEGRP